MIGSFSSEVELPHQVEWTTVGSPNTVSRDYLAISSMIPAAGSGAGAAEAGSNADAGEAHPTALLSLGAMQCLLCGDRTPVLHVRCGWDPGSDDEQPCDPQLDANSVFNGFVLSAGGDILCFALSRQSTAAQCAAVLTSLQEHASVYELELPLGEWEGVTTAPTAERSQVPDWMVSRMHRGSAALQRAILVSARVVADGCDRVGAGVSAVMPERRLPQLPWEEAERMQQGLEAARSSIRRVSDVNQHAMEQGLDAGRRAVAHGSKVWGGPHCPAAAAPAASAGLGLGGRRSPPPAGRYSPEGRISPPPRSSPRHSPRHSPSCGPSCAEGRHGADERHVLRVPVLDLPPAAQTAPAQSTAAAQSTAPPVRPQPRRAEQHVAPEAGCAATAEDKAEEGAPAGAPPSPPGEEVALAVTGSGGAPGSSLARGRLPSAMTACVDSGGALRWVRPTLSASGGALAAAVDSASQAKGLVYVSFKQASSEVATKLCGPAAGVVTAEGLDTLSAARSTLASLPINPVGWLLAAVGGQEQPRLLSTAVGATAESGAESAPVNAEGEGWETTEEPWVLLGKPCKEDYLALWLPGRTTVWDPHSPAADLPPTAAPHASRPVATSPPAAPPCAAPPPALPSGTASSSAPSSSAPSSIEDAAAALAAALAGDTADTAAASYTAAAAASSPSPATALAATPPSPPPTTAATASTAPAPSCYASAPAPAAAASTATDGTTAAAAAAADDGGTDDPGAWHDAWGEGRRGGKAATAGGWRRMWCVLHDSVMALFEHRRALEEASGSEALEFEGFEWSQVSGIALWPPCAFELKLRDGRTLALAADTQAATADWVCSILRLVSRRAVLTLQQEQRGEWETVVTEAPADL